MPAAARARRARREAGDLSGAMKFAILLVIAVAGALLNFPPFNRSRRGSARAGARLTDLLSSVPLSNKETLFAGIWQRGELDGARVAFQTDNRTLVIYAGHVRPDGFFRRVLL